MNQRRNILFVDEAVFTQRSTIKKVWAKTSEEATIFKDSYGFNCTSVVAATNLKGETVALVTSGKSIKAPEFVQFLKQIRNRMGKSKVYIFLDNLRMHHMPIIKDTAF